jgi:hypothetical protein
MELQPDPFRYEVEWIVDDMDGMDGMDDIDAMDDMDDMDDMVLLPSLFALIDDRDPSHLYHLSIFSMPLMSQFANAGPPLASSSPASPCFNLWIAVCRP